jgi:parallel beta-helix repeat protein
VERCGFFDANLVGEEYDRVYLASQFAAYFASFIGNGVFAEHSNQLQVMEMATPQMQIGVERGQAWINGYWYENTDMLYLPIDVADGVLNRIDSVVLRLGFSERNMWLAVKKGTPAINPIAPEVTRTADYYELQLATISIPAGSIKITQAQITDTRMNQNVCGWVTGVIDQVDTTTLFNQYVDWYTTTTGQAEQDWNDWFSQQQTEGFVMAAEKGQPNGIATLDENGKVPDEQLPEIEVPVTSVNEKTGDVVLTAEDVGAETPTGAQAKANAALNSAKQYTDQEVGEVTQELAAHKADGTQHAKTARFVIGTSTSGWTEKDCDYLCDGTNDQEEIIQALNGLPAAGGEVVILDGTYNITASINIPKDNVSLRGNGNATILKRMYNSTDTGSGATARGLITLNEKSGCKIQGLQIDGNKAIYAASYSYGISLFSSSNNTVTGNTCNNNYNGIFLSLSSNNTVTGNTCSNNNNTGIYLYSPSNNNTVTGNTCSNNNYNGIFLSLSSNDNTVTGNTCNNNYNGIYLYSSSNNNTVTGNTCNNNNYNGIYLYSSSNNNTVTGNTCNNNNTGISLFSSSNNTVTGNTCIRGTGQTSDYDSDQYTIRLQGNNNYNLISSNNCMGKDVVIGVGTSNTSVNNKYN